jgi:hypothetical protein
MTGRRAGFLVLLVVAVRLVAAPPEPIQKPVKLLGLGENVDREFATLVKFQQRDYTLNVSVVSSVGQRRMPPARAWRNGRLTRKACYFVDRTL